MKGIIIYAGKYGATAQYAKWLSETMQLPAVNLKELNAGLLAGAELVIIGSSIYVGSLLVKDWLHKHAALLQTKKVYFFIVGASVASDKDKQAHVIGANIPALNGLEKNVFFLPGRLDLKKLSWKDKLLLKLGSMLEKDPVKKKAMRTGIDAVAKEQLADLINALQVAEAQLEKII